MATASVSTSSECSICMESFTIPKITPCGHTFCLGCLDRYIGDRTDTFPCPICKKKVKIPKGGAKMFVTNFILQTSPHTTQVTGTTSPTTQVTGTTSPTTQVTGTTSPTTKYHCPCHRERQINCYCLTCHCVLCYRCFLKEHNGHEYLDVECETTKEKAAEIVMTSEKFIQNKIKHLEETHAALVEAKETLQRFTEDACSRITKQTDKMISDLKASSERIMTDIKNKSEESESELTKTGEKIKGDIKTFKLNLETNFPSLTKDCSSQILVSLEKIKELEELCKDVKVRTSSVVQYVDWNEKDFSLDMNMLGSVVLKQHHIPKLHDSMVLKQHHIPKLHKSNSYQFLFNINDIKNDEWYYCQDKFSYSNLVWSYSVRRSYDDDLYIYIKLLPDDNPKLNYCIIDSQLSILNIDTDSKTITDTVSDERLERGGRWVCPITWSKLTDKNNGYLNSNSQFVIQFDITQIREISWE